jgi:hypothetical protein
MPFATLSGFLWIYPFARKAMSCMDVFAIAEWHADGVANGSQDEPHAPHANRRHMWLAHGTSSFCASKPISHSTSTVFTDMQCDG